MQSMIDKMFKQVDDVVLDISTQKIGVKKNNSILVFDDTDDTNPVICENPLVDLSLAVPAYAQAKPLEQVKYSDLILNQAGEILGWVTKINPKSLKVLKPTGQITTVYPNKVVLADQGQSVMVVMNMTQTNQSDSSMNPMMMLAMMKDGTDLDPMMMMALSGGCDMNTMLPLMLMKDSDIDASKLMLLMSMMGNNQNNASMQSMNPMMLMALMGKK